MRPLRTLVAVVALVVANPTAASAHDGLPLAPHDVWTAWAVDPWALFGVGFATVAYAVGARRLWAKAGAGRGIARWRFRCYAAAISLLFLALVSPLDPLGGALFSAHMAQHEILVLCAAPLLVLGKPFVAYVWALPATWRRGVGAFVRTRAVRRSWAVLSSPLAAWSLHAAAILAWHIPTLYERSLDSGTAHALQHISFFGTAALFWWAILHPSHHRRLAPALAVLYLFTTALYGSALGALLALSPVPWYPAYAEGAALWGLTPLEDQQLGGLLIWVPFGTFYLLGGLGLMGLWLRAGMTEDLLAPYHARIRPERDSAAPGLPRN